MKALTKSAREEIMNFKKLTSILAAGAMAFSLAACGSSSAAPAETKESAPAEATEAESTAEAVESAVADAAGEDLSGKSVGFSALMMSSEFFTDMSNQMEAYFTERGMTYDVADANGNAQTQIQTIENFEQMGKDYIICFVVDKASIGDTLKKARENGAFVIVIGTVLEDKDAADVCISISQEESGKVEAQIASDWIDKTFPDAEEGSVKVGLLTNSENEDAVARCNGLRSLADINKKVTIVEEHETTQAEGAAVAQSYAEMELMNNPDLAAILTYGTDQGQGANEAVMADDSIEKDKFAVFTVDTAEFIREKIRESATGESVLRGTVMLGEGTPMTCYKLMDGEWMERVEDGVYSERCIEITPDTIDQYFPNDN